MHYRIRTKMVDEKNEKTIDEINLIISYRSVAFHRVYQIKKMRITK